MERRKWFERQFSLGLGVEAMPELVERLRGTALRLEERVSDLEPAAATRRNDSSWSIQEHVGHLLDLESLWADRLQDLAEGRPRLRPAPMSVVDLCFFVGEHDDHHLASITERRRALAGDQA